MRVEVEDKNVFSKLLKPWLFLRYQFCYIPSIINLNPYPTFRSLPKFQIRSSCVHIWHAADKFRILEKNSSGVTCPARLSNTSRKPHLNILTRKGTQLCLNMSNSRKKWFSVNCETLWKLFCTYNHQTSELSVEW